MPGTLRRIGREPVASTSLTNGSVAPPASLTLRMDGSTAAAAVPVKKRDAVVPPPSRGFQFDLGARNFLRQHR